MPGVARIRSSLRVLIRRLNSPRREICGGVRSAIEHTGTDAAYFERACADHGGQISVSDRDRALTPPGDKDYFYQTR
jgi:hypothetical protein